MTVGMATKAGIEINMGGWIISVVAALLVACVGWILIMFITPGCKVDKLKNVDITKFQKRKRTINKTAKSSSIYLAD